jgi:hypothetical protein
MQAILAGSQKIILCGRIQKPLELGHCLPLHGHTFAGQKMANTMLVPISWLQKFHIHIKPKRVRRTPDHCLLTMLPSQNQHTSLCGRRQRGLSFPLPRPRSPEAQAYIDYVERNYYRSFANPFPLQLRLLKAAQSSFDRQAAFDALSSRPSQGNWVLLKNNLVVDINTGLMGMMIRGPRRASGVMHGISTSMPSERGSKLVARMMQYVQARKILKKHQMRAAKLMKEFLGLTQSETEIGVITSR